MDLTQRLDWEDEKEETAVDRHRPVGNLHMFAGTHGPAQDFPIYPGPNVIGRHSSCDITLPAQSVSKKHAVLCVTGDCHTICDNGSLNKTRRSKVALEPDVRYSLSDGDFLLFADVACRYTILKKIEVEAAVAEESEDDSMLVPGTQVALAIEKTPGAAIRRMGCGAVLARDSEDEDEGVQRGWRDGGEGGSKDAPRTSGPAAGALFSPDADTVVPESDEENDTSSSGTRFTSFHLHCDSDTDNRETPTKESSFIPSSLNRFTPAAVKEPAKEESSRLLQTNKDEKPVGEQKDEEKEISSVGRDIVSDSGLLEERKETSKNGADDRLPCVGERVVQTDTLDSELKDGGTKAINRSNSNEDKNNLKNDAANIDTSEVSSTSSHCLKDNEDETSRRDIASPAIESNPDSHTQEEENLKPAEEKLKVAADLCLDSDTDSDEDAPTTSGTDIKKKDDLDIKSDKAPEQSSVDGTSDAGVNMARDVNVDEDKEKISAVQHGGVGEINIDSDTDVEDDTEVSETGNAESRTGNGNASEVHEVHSISGTNVSTGFDIDSDTDVEDADITRSDGKVVDQESREFVDEKKEQFHLDSDTDVEDNGDVSSTKVRKGDLDSVAADVQLKETKDGIHMDSDTDVEEDVNVSSTDVTKGKQTLNTDVQEGFHVDSDTDVEDVDVSSTVVTKEKPDSSNSVKDAREGLPLDSDTDVDEEDQGPGPSSAAVQSRTTESHIDELQSEMGKNEKEAVSVTNKEAADLHFDSDTDEDDGTSTGPKKAGGSAKTDAEKNEAEAANEAAALHIDSDTDVDEDDASLRLDQSQTAEGERHSNGVSEGGVGSLDKVAGTSVGVKSQVPKADASTVSVKSSEEETSKADSQGADYELMATQCYLEPQLPEEDLPDEEEATQAYILSSTWKEPDTFKRPSDPIGVLQISAVTLDKCEEEVDENAIAETQLFCLGADESPGSDFKETPQLEEQVMDDQQDPQPSSSVAELRQEAQEPPQGAILQEDTEPVSQCLSAKPPVETGTSLYLKRDVPAAVWMKGLQQGETSNVKEDSTQDEQDLPPLELEATQSFILEVPNIQEHCKQDHDSSFLAVQVDHTKVDESAVPATENPPKDPIALGPGVEVPATEIPPTGLSIPERDVSPVLSTESTPTGPSILEAVPANESPLTESSILETGVSAASLTEGPPTEPSSLKLDVSAVPATESPPKELSNMETQVNNDDATQAYILNFPVSDANVPQSNLEVPSNEDANQPCSSDVEYTASKEAESSGVTMLAVGEEEPKLTDTGKGKPSSKRGLSRSRKKEQPEKSTEIPTEKAAPAAHSAPEETAELCAGELVQSGPRIVVSETREEIEPEKDGRRGGGWRKATEESKTKAKTKNELVVPTASRKRSSRIASEAEPSTSGNNEIRRKQPSRESIVKVQEEKQDESKEDFGSAPKKCKKSDVFETLSDNYPKKIGLRSEFENVTGPTSMELSVGQMESDEERDVTSTLLEPNGDKNVSSSKTTEGNESRILDLPEQTETISAPQNKKPVRGKRQAATKAKQDNTQTISNDVADKMESETSGTNLETQDGFKIPTPRTNDLQDGGNEGPRGRRTRTSRISTSEPLEHEKPKGADTKASQNEDANKTCPGNQNSANTRSTRQRRNVKEEAKEDSQKEQTGRSKRAINLRGNQKNKERNSEHTLEDNSGSSSLPKRTQNHSKEETPKPEDVPEVGKIEEDNMGKLPRRTRKGYKEEQKLEDNKGSLQSSNTAEAQTAKRTQRGSKGQDIVAKEETVKETVTRQRRNSKSKDTQLGEDQGKRSVRTRRLSKEEVVEETTADTTKENTAGQNTSRRTRRNVKAEKTESEHAGDLKPDKELSQSERSSSRTRRKTSTEDSGKLTENTEVEEELSEGTKKGADEETSKKGRTMSTSAKVELPQVSTPMANRKRGQALKADVNLKRKRSDDTSEAKEEIPAGRRGRPRKLSTTDDSQTSAGGSREISTPEPSPSCNSRLRQSPALSNLAEVLTPRRTGRGRIPQPGAPPKVLFTGVVDATGEEIIRSLGGDIADSVFDCTHLITTNHVRRTVKFLCALARGIPIVTLDWIDKCKKSGCFLSPTQFLVKDKEQEKNFNFALSESLQKAKRSPLFKGYEIHITPSVQPDSELMKDIICCSGATFLPKMPRTFKEKCVIVSCPEDAAQCKSVPSRIPITTAEFILSGILRQEVNPSAYLLSSEMEDNAPAPAKRRR